ncbi:MAG: hypothetical protein WBA89_20425 [Microcoleus sp.]
MKHSELAVPRSGASRRSQQNNLKINLQQGDCMSMLKKDVRVVKP